MMPVTESIFAFVFPGQGSQSLGMLSEFAVLYPEILDTFAEASEGAGVDLWTLSQRGPEEMLNRTEYTQPALLAASVALWRLWQARGGRAPDLFAGHSLGEYSALVAAGALSLKDGAYLVRLRGQLMQDAVAVGVGAMAAVLGAEDALVAEVCAQVAGSEIVVPANFNSPGQVVIGGHATAVDRVLVLLAERGVSKTVKLAVSVPSHTPLMRDAAHRLAEAMLGLVWKVPQIPVVQNVDGRVHDGVEAIREALVKQLYLPVQWTDCVRELATCGVVHIAECGPGKVLMGLIRRIDKTLDVRSLATPTGFSDVLDEWVF